MGAARVARERKQRSVARKVDWLLGLRQCTASHHTAPGNVPTPGNGLTLMETLVARLDDLQIQVTTLASLITELQDTTAGASGKEVTQEQKQETKPQVNKAYEHEFTAKFDHMLAKYEQLDGKVAALQAELISYANEEDSHDLSTATDPKSAKSKVEQSGANVDRQDKDDKHAHSLVASSPPEESRFCMDCRMASKVLVGPGVCKACWQHVIGTS